MGENRMFGRQEAGVQHYVEFDVRVNRWVPLCGQHMVDGDIEASSKPFYADEPVCTNCREQAGELKRVVFRIAPSMAKSLSNNAIRQTVEKFLSALGQLSESNLLRAIENPPHRATEDAAAEVEILRRQLATAQEMMAKADEHSRALSAEIERLRGENRLILDALGMEKYRVRWRPVSDEGFKNAMGEEMLIVYDGPVWVTRLIMISRWSPVAGWNLRNGNPVADGTVTHWAPLPGLPEID